MIDLAVELAIWSIVALIAGLLCLGSIVGIGGLVVMFFVTVWVFLNAE